MRAAFLPTPGRVEVGDFPVPEPGEGELLVRMEYASICGSDVHITYDGFHREECLGLPGYPGHEGVGTVVASNADTAAGARVLTVPLPTPGGCFGEYLAVAGSQVVELPPDADPRRLLLAQQLGTTIFAMRRFFRGVGDGVAAVIGCGSAGLFLVQQLRQRGFHTVVAADVNAYRLGIASRLGATSTVQAPGDDVVTAVLDVTGGVGADLVIEAAGFDACREQAVEAVRVGGTVGCFGYPERPGLSTFPVERAFKKSLSIEWICRTQEEPGLVSFRDAVTAIQDGSIEIDYCLGGGFPLEDMPRAMATARDHSRDLVKVELDLQPTG